jgi:uncharacterized protein
MEGFCLITGAASGLGLAFARKFLNENYNLVLVDKDFDGLKLVKAELDQLGKGVVFIIHQDLSLEGSARNIYDEVVRLGVKIRILINNAGFGIFGLFSEVPENAILDLIRLSVLTTTHLTRLFLKDMVESGGGKIMLVSSLAAFQPAPVMSVYAASKVYLLYLGEALANETKDAGISVTVLCPGMINTNFQKVTGNKKPRIQWNISSAEQIANYGYRALIKGKIVAIPGLWSKVMATLHRFFPRKVATSLIRRIHEANRQE